MFQQSSNSRKAIKRTRVEVSAFSGDGSFRFLDGMIRLEELAHVRHTQQRLHLCVHRGQGHFAIRFLDSQVRADEGTQSGRIDKRNVAEIHDQDRRRVGANGSLEIKNRVNIQRAFEPENGLPGATACRGNDLHIFFEHEA